MIFGVAPYGTLKIATSDDSQLLKLAMEVCISRDSAIGLAISGSGTGSDSAGTGSEMGSGSAAGSGAGSGSG